MNNITVKVPGRVNLIGEHLDYNGGTVLPSALPLTLDVQMRLRSDNRLAILSERADAPVQRTLDDKAEGHWSDHAVGAAAEARSLGLLSTGVDIRIDSAIPAGAGLSSSAALIVAILKAARSLSGRDDLSDIDVAVAARRVENEFIGVPCGIMDQMAVAIAAPGQALALDTDTLNFDLVDLLPDYSFVVMHSGVSRELSDGRYRERKVECDQAAALLNTDALCQLSESALDGPSQLPSVLKARARHCITEHRRVQASIQAIRAGDARLLGSLMRQSHVSMRDDFEISTTEIDRLVGDAECLGALGARLTGGGFGGCFVCLVSNDQLDNWRKTMLSANPETTWITAITQTRATDRS